MDSENKTNDGIMGATTLNKNKNGPGSLGFAIMLTFSIVNIAHKTVITELILKFKKCKISGGLKV